MAETTFTFLDGAGASKTALAGQNGSSQLAPAAVLYAVDGTQLIGQKARAASLPIALSTEDAALLADLLTITAFQARIPALSGGRVPIEVDSAALAALESITIGTALPAGENHLGEVGSKTLLVTATPTISTSPAYSAGDALGGLLTLTSAVRVAGGSGRIETVTIADKAKQNATIDVLFFVANPSGTTVTDNSVLTVADADLLNLIGVAQVVNWYSFADNSVGVVPNAGIRFKLGSGTSLYAPLVNRSTPTYASTSDIQLSVGIQAD